MKVLEEKMKTQVLNGISIKHSLYEDSQYNITKKVMERFVDSGCKQVFVVQHYPDNFIQSSEVISFIGVQSDNKKEQFYFSQEIELPRANYLSTTFDPSRVDIDKAYQKIYQELVEKNINELSNYDIEMVDHNNNMTSILIPKEAYVLQNSDFFTFEEYQELSW